MTYEQLETFIFDEFGFCGCGDPYVALDLLRDALQAFHDRSADNKRGCENWSEHSDKINALLGLTKSPGMYYLFLYHLHHCELTEHGGNVGGSWLSPKGEEVLAALKVPGAIDRLVE